jgi:DNA-binding winged helix-turn-helix (wHTH) protein
MVLRLEDCEIDCDRRRIVRGGQERPLSRKAFDLLVVLLENRPKVLSKDALIKQIWADTFVADANLAILIGHVRGALGDSADKPRLIKTHHAVGYSFIGKVTEVVDRTDAGRLPSFILLDGNRRIPLFDGIVTVGRDTSCDAVLVHRSVSRLHARLVIAEGAIVVEDNDSKNGTRIDDLPLTEAASILPGQRLTFGSVDTSIAVNSASSTMTIEDN